MVIQWSWIIPFVVAVVVIGIPKPLAFGHQLFGQIECELVGEKNCWRRKMHQEQREEPDNLKPVFSIRFGEIFLKTMFSFKFQIENKENSRGYFSSISLNSSLFELNVCWLGDKREEESALDYEIFLFIIFVFVLVVEIEFEFQNNFSVFLPSFPSLSSTRRFHFGSPLFVPVWMFFQMFLTQTLVVVVLAVEYVWSSQWRAQRDWGSLQWSIVFHQVGSSREYSRCLFSICSAWVFWEYSRCSFTICPAWVFWEYSRCSFSIGSGWVFWGYSRCAFSIGSAFVQYSENILAVRSLSLLFEYFENIFCFFVVFILFMFSNRQFNVDSQKYFRHIL